MNAMEKTRVLVGTKIILCILINNINCTLNNIYNTYNLLF
jgi:hypothetical protein